MREADPDPLYVALALEDATSREEIFELLVRATRALTSFAAVLSIHPDHLRGELAVASLRLPREVRRFEKAIASGEAVIGPLAMGDTFVDGLVEQLGGPTQAALVVPILVDGRPVALLVAHRGDAPLTTDDVAPLGPLAIAAGAALGRVLEIRARAVTSPRLTRHETAYDIEIIVADASNRAATLSGLRAGEDWEGMADAIRDLLRAGDQLDETEQLELLLELGHLEAERLGRPERAIEAWRSAQTIDTGDARVLDALHGVLAAQGRWRECAELLEQRVALAEDPARRIELLLELAAVAHERLGDPDAAIAAYERILHRDPDHATATRELEALYAAGARWESLAAFHLDRASRVDDAAEAVAILESVAQIYEHKAGDPRAAFLVWLAIARRQPGRTDLVEQLARLGPAAAAWDEVLAETTALAEELEAAHPALARDLWRVLAGWLGERGHWTELVSLLARLADIEDDRGERGALYAQLGALHDFELDHPAAAIEWYEKALADEPEHRAVLAALARLYRRSQHWGALAELLPQQIAVLDPETDLAAIVDAHVELGRVLGDRLDRPDDAVRSYQRALELVPTCAPALEALRRIYQATGQTEALLDATETEIDAADRDARILRYPELATRWHEHGNLERAAACWRKLLALAPDHIEAHRGLARTLRSAERWPELAATLRAMVELAPTAERVAVLIELAEVLEARLDDPEGALAAARGALELDSAHRGALDMLARLHDRADRPRAALEALQALLEHTDDRATRADLLQRIGHAHLNVRDLAEAGVAFAQAFALDARNPTAYEGMARLHLMKDDVIAAGEAQIRAAELSTSVPDQIRRWADAAWIFRHRLHDTERARQCLHVILDLDPDHRDAKLALAGLLQDLEQWEVLWPHLEAELARAEASPDMPAAERGDLYRRAARCALELDRFETALDLYERACGIDASAATLLERADALYRSRSLEAAAASFQTLARRDDLDRAQRVATYRRLAEIHEALGKPIQAQAFHLQVLELEPGHRATLEDVAELQIARGRYDAAVATLRSLAEVVEPGERVEILATMGDLYAQHLRNPPRAISMYLEALELDAGNRRILQRLLDVQSDAGQWRAAVETIGRFLEHETEPARRGAYHLAEAEIRRTELRDRPGALACYERALDELFREEPLTAATRARGIEVFKVIDELVTADRNWTYLEQSYKRMIRRTPKDDPVLIALWHALGELYRTRLGKPEHAIEALEVAHALDPDRSRERAARLSELYARTGKPRPATAQPVDIDPDHPDAYRATARASLEAGRIDAAWCAARALVFVKQANAEEHALYTRYRARETDKATGILDEDTWAHVRHADEDRVISSIFALVWQGPVALRAGPAKSFELRPSERIPVEDGTRVIAKIFRHAARVLGVALPDVYVQPRRSGRLLLANCIERGRLQPAVIVGRDLMTGYRDTEIAAAVGAMLALVRPAYHLRLTLPTVDELEAALAAAAQVVGIELGRPELEPQRTAFAAEIAPRLSREATTVLRGLVARLPERPDVARWRTAVDMMAQRAGLLVCGELAAATRMLATSGGAHPARRIQDLVTYSVSPAYFAVRAHLGVTV